MRAIDTYEAARVAALAPQLQSSGIEAVGLYYFKSSNFKHLLTKAIAEKVAAAGLQLFSIWENGEPTHGGYFTAECGAEDGQNAALLALESGQPAGTPIFATIDYDPSESDLEGITAYFAAFRAGVMADGYLSGAYGSGMALRHLLDKGLIHFSYLSQSRGFQGYHDFYSSADIVQGPVAGLLGLDIDGDTIKTPAVLWMPAP